MFVRFLHKGGNAIDCESGHSQILLYNYELFSSVGDFLLVSLDFAFLIKLGLYVAHEVKSTIFLNVYIHFFMHLAIPKYLLITFCRQCVRYWRQDKE